jgi:inhibitor of cysteine peptidase
MADVELTGADDGRRVPVRVGDRVVVRLPETPSTGYRWELDVPDESPVELVDSSWNAVDDPGVGAGGDRRLVLTIRRAGSAELNFALRRAWQPASAADERVVIVVDGVETDDASAP